MEAFLCKRAVQTCPPWRAGCLAMPPEAAPSPLGLHLPTPCALDTPLASGWLSGLPWQQPGAAWGDFEGAGHVCTFGVGLGSAGKSEPLEDVAEPRRGFHTVLSLHSGIVRDDAGLCYAGRLLSGIAYNLGRADASM